MRISSRAKVKERFSLLRSGPSTTVMRSFSMRRTSTPCAIITCVRGGRPSGEPASGALGTPVLTCGH
jgi:hypothetical protein